MLLCDQVIREAGSGKPSLIGVFENVIAPEAPTANHPHVHLMMTLYAKISGAEGKYKWRFEVVRDRENTVIAGADIDEIQHPNRLGTHDLVVNMGLMQFSELGRYSIRLFANDRFVGDIVFDVVIFKQQGS